MPNQSPATLDFLAKRRSRPAKTLRGPWPAREDLAPLIALGLRVPDHGKLEPWRLMVLDGSAPARLAKAAMTRAEILGHEPEKIEKTRRQFADAGVIVAVIASPIDSEKVPKVEQILSAGCVCLNLLSAALAAGWGANWLTGWTALDEDFLMRELGLAAGEFVAGYIHIGTETAAPPERPRPDPAVKVTWVGA